MQKEGESSRNVATSRTVFFVLLGVLVLGAGMIGFSILSPKQLTTCTGVGGSSAMICEMQYVSRGTICTQEVSPSLSEAVCLASPSFWQFTKFWVFDVGIVGLILVVSSASIAALVLAHGKYYGRKTKTRQEKIEPILPKANPQHLTVQLL